MYSSKMISGNILLQNNKTDIMLATQQQIQFAIWYLWRQTEMSEL
jgi:hypothetical protein